MASVSVKIPTAKVIALLEEKIASLNEEIANYPKAKEDYAKAVKAHQENIVALTIQALTTKPEMVGSNYDSPIRVQTNNYGRGSSVSVTIDADALGFPASPTEPKNPNDTISVGREWVKPLEVLENTLRTLRLTEQETITSSTYANVMRLL
jgi:hypothetical protein